MLLILYQHDMYLKVDNNVGEKCFKNPTCVNVVTNSKQHFYPIGYKTRQISMQVSDRSRYTFHEYIISQILHIQLPRVNNFVENICTHLKFDHTQLHVSGWLKTTNHFLLCNNKKFNLNTNKVELYTKVIKMNVP